MSGTITPYLQFICFPKLDNLAAATFSIALLITGYSFNISLKSSTSRLYKEHIVTAKIEATRRPFVKSRISKKVISFVTQKSTKANGPEVAGPMLAGPNRTVPVKWKLNLTICYWAVEMDGQDRAEKNGRSKLLRRNWTDMTKPLKTGTYKW